jgi:serine/threonine-protein kinase SRPK3
MIFGERLFGSIDEFQSLELMIKYLGTPPRDLLDRCKRSDDFFDKQGWWFVD